VHEVFSSHAGKELNYQLGSPWGSQLHRAGNLGTRLVKRLVPEQVETEDEDEAPSLTIASLGPVAMIYWRDHLSESERSWLAKRLVAEARVPAVLYLDNHGTVHGWHDGGHIRLPEDGEKIIEEDHPFLHLAIEDLTQLCSHKNAGDFVVLGRSGKGETAVTFASENGAHGGAGPEETSAFALLPRDTEAVPDESESFRVRDLRQAAMHIQHRAPDATRRFSVGKRPSGKGLRVVTWSVRGCLGMAGRLSPGRIARVIARC
jgi:hypothetical protein